MTREEAMERAQRWLERHGHDNVHSLANLLLRVGTERDTKVASLKGQLGHWQAEAEAAEARGYARGIEAAAGLLSVQGDPGAWPWAERVRALGKGAGE
jgi:hypothetical protein